MWLRLPQVYEEHDPEDAYRAKELLAAVENQISTWKGRRLTVFNRINGLKGERVCSAKEIASEYGLSASYVRYLNQRCCEDLQKTVRDFYETERVSIDYYARQKEIQKANALAEFTRRVKSAIYALPQVRVHTIRPRIQWLLAELMENTVQIRFRLAAEEIHKGMLVGRAVFRLSDLSPNFETQPGETFQLVE